jgi:hypothetical protein
MQQALNLKTHSEIKPDSYMYGRAVMHHLQKTA